MKPLPLPGPLCVLTVPDWYLEWCWDQEELQAWWRKLWTDEHGTLQCNINPGDRFSHSRAKQVSLVCEKTFHVCVGIGEPNYYSYRIAHDIGGHWPEPKHEELASGWYLWLPTAEQLAVLGYTKQAERLLAEFLRMHLEGKSN